MWRKRGQVDGTTYECVGDDSSPFVWLLSKSTELIFNLLGIKGDDGKVTEEEIKSIIKEGAEEGL